MRRDTPPTCSCSRPASYVIPPEGFVLCSVCAAGELDAIPLNPRRDFSRLGVRASHVRARVSDTLAARRERLNAEMPSKEGEEWAATIAALMVGGGES